MPCFSPLPGWRTPTGTVQISKQPIAGGTYLPLPCTRCIGCTERIAKQWALRCELELQQHQHASFATLTYDRDHVPPTLQKRDLQLALKRLRRPRAAKSLRYFASGEYGETNHRPHYHALLYGFAPTERQALDEAWGLGFTELEPVNLARIHYVAGYTAKKLSDRFDAKHERVDPETGEVYTWQPPFITMSLRPGIGGHARKWPAMWRAYAVDTNGNKMPVPRFLHEAWKRGATEAELQQLEKEKEYIRTTLLTDTAKQQNLTAAEAILRARHALRSQTRRA